MRRGSVILVAALVLLAAVGVFLVTLYLASKTGNAALDRLRTLVTASLVRRFGPRATPDKARAVMAIINNETGGAPAPQIGDVDLPGGPSIGPGQVYRSTAQELGLWAPPPDVAGDDQAERDAYASVANDEATCVDWAVAVFKAKLAAAGGDVADAIRRYNGGGSAAEAYKQRALDFIASTWGGTDASA